MTAATRQYVSEVFADWASRGLFRNCEMKKVTSVKAGTPTPWRNAATIVVESKQDTRHKQYVRRKQAKKLGIAEPKMIGAPE